MKMATSDSQQHLLEKIPKDKQLKLNRVIRAMDQFVSVSMVPDNEPDSMGNYHEGIELQDALIELLDLQGP